MHHVGALIARSWPIDYPAALPWARRMVGEVRRAHPRRAVEYTDLLGSMASVHATDRLLVASRADRLRGLVLDAGCGPGHWSVYLAERQVTHPRRRPGTGLPRSGPDPPPRYPVPRRQHRRSGCSTRTHGWRARLVLIGPPRTEPDPATTWGDRPRPRAWQRTADRFLRGIDDRMVRARGHSRLPVTSSRAR